jgi:hypothetical protein
VSGLVVYFIRLQKAARCCAGIRAEVKETTPFVDFGTCTKEQDKKGRKIRVSGARPRGSFLLLRYGARVRKTVRIETIE